MIALVFLATVINYLDRQTLSVAAPVLREQFHMSNQDYSRVVFAFLLAYTISNGVSGGHAGSPRDAGRLRDLCRRVVGGSDDARARHWPSVSGGSAVPVGFRRKPETGRLA